MDRARDSAHSACNRARKQGRPERIPGLALGHRKTHREGAQRKALRLLASAWCAVATLPVLAETQNCGRFQGSRWLNITGFCWRLLKRKIHTSGTRLIFPFIQGRIGTPRCL